MRRPPLISSTVDAFLAIIAGEWNDVAATRGPNSIRSVASPNAANIDQASQGPRASVTSSLKIKWSPTQTESNPHCSAVVAMSRTSSQLTSRSTSGSWIPIFMFSTIEAS